MMKPGKGVIFVKPYIISNHRQNRLAGFAAVLFGLFLASIIVSPTFAVPTTEWEVSPSSPYVGDTLVITGTTVPSAELRADVSFVKTASVSNGAYSYRLAEIKIPEGEKNRFTVQAESVQSLTVGVKTSILPWITRTGTVHEGVGSYSHSDVPSWTYEVKIFGDAAAGESSVDLTVTASQVISADSNGNFRYEYDTDTMPAGDYKINIGGVSKTITLRERSSSSGGGSSTGAATIISVETVEEVPEATGNESENEEGAGDEEDGGYVEFEGEGGTPDGTPDGTSDGQEAGDGDVSQPETQVEEEPPLDGSFMVFGILGSLLVISLIRKSGK